MINTAYQRAGSGEQPATTSLDDEQWLKSDEPVLFSALQLKPKCEDNVWIVNVVNCIFL